MSTKPSSKYDWKSLRVALVTHAHRAVLEIVKANPDQTLYAIAFHSSYRELGGVLSFPLLAANSLEESHSHQNSHANEGFYSIKWNPPDWRWVELGYMDAALVALEASLQTEATSDDQLNWTKVEARFIKEVATAAKELGSQLSRESWAGKNLVVFFHDEAGGADLARKSIRPGLFNRLFPEQDETELDRRRVAMMPVEERVSYYVGRFGIFDGISSEESQERLVEIGRPAISSLTALLPNPDHGWLAARLLGRIGISEEATVNELRRQVCEQRGSANWSARSLGLLGDWEFLLKLSGKKGTRSSAVDGIIARYQAWADDCITHHDLNYRPLEQLLELKEEQCIRQAEDNLSPGRSYCQVTSGDISEALRGLVSPHRLIRWHAVSVLGERRLGKAAGKKVLPELVKRLKDEDATVREQAILNIFFWGDAAHAYSSEIMDSLEDESESVRKAAQRVLNQ